MTRRILPLLALVVWLPDASAQVLDGYHDYEALTSRLNQIVQANPQAARLQSIGKTLQNRDIWVLELGTGRDRSERPALFVAANLEGNQLAGTELVLEAAGTLLADADLLARRTFYLVPRANPDGAQKAFAAVRAGSRTNTSAYDDDNDARTDEDGPEDLNGDGLITVMRVADPNGAYTADEDEPRLMKKADATKGESGTHSLYIEGTDNDGDGYYNEDPAGGVDINRNFQHEYPYYQADAGIHMVSERESRALMDFIVAHRNIAAILTYGESDNLVTAPNDKGELGPAAGIDLETFAAASNDGAREVGVFRTQTRRFFGFGGGSSAGQSGGRPSSGQRPATTVSRDDLAYFTSVSEQYRELTGLEATPPIRKPEGALFGYGYYQFGVPSFSTPGWAPASGDSAAAAPARGGRRGGGASVDSKLLKWMESAGVDGFVDWAAFDHPQLGEVEIGGFAPYAAYNPPRAVLEDLSAQQGAFMSWLAGRTAQVGIAHTEVTDEGGGIFRIKAEVANTGWLPTSTAHGVRSRSVKPTMVQLGIPPEDLLSGSAKTSFFQATDGSGRRQSFEWIIKGRRGDSVELRVVSQKGGTDTATLTLR